MNVVIDLICIGCEARKENEKETVSIGIRTSNSSIGTPRLYTYSKHSRSSEWQQFAPQAHTSEIKHDVHLSDRCMEIARTMAVTSF